jgi:hypothetical protein
MFRNATNLAPPSPRANETDVRRWPASRELVQLALDAVQTLDWSNANLISRSTRRYRPQMMVTLLGYCYATGIYGSEQIEQAIRQNETVRYICARDYPDWAAIRQFRRENRLVLEQCLAYVLKQAWARSQDLAAPGVWACQPSEAEQSRQAQREAYQRLEVAAFMDLMQREE